MTARSSADAFARLFEAVHEGVFIGTLAHSDSREASSTLAANPHLKRIFGYASDTPEHDVAPFVAERFCEPVARASFLERLTRHGTVTDHLLRMRRIDGSPVWVEVTARAEVSHAPNPIRIEALVRDVSERKRLDDQSRDLYQQLYATQLDEAYGDPRMDEVVSLLQGVSRRSVDAPSAIALLHAIDNGRTELAKIHAEREKLSQAAAEVVAQRTNIDPAHVLEEPDAGPIQDPYGPGASISQINKDTGGCLVSAEPFHETGTNKTGTLYRLASNPACKDRLPGFVGQVVMMSEGRMYRRVPESQVPRPAATPDAGAASGGSSAPHRQGGSGAAGTHGAGSTALAHEAADGGSGY